MDVEVLSNTVQMFNGVSYYSCGNYYQRKGIRLHRTVWEYNNGTIPDGYHIHHIDGNTSNNKLSNLALLKGSDHLRTHMRTEKRKEQSKQSLDKVRDKASVWHSTPEGIVWHSQRGKANWELRQDNLYNCTYCGKEFTTKHIYSKHSNHFCTPKCKAAYRRWRIKNGVSN